MFRSALLTTFALFAIANAQGVGTNQAEQHPSITVQQCSAGGTCTTKQASIVLDANWRWIHVKGGYTNCYTGSKWNDTVCSDPKKCAEQCELEGAEYSSTYGITTSGNALTLKFIQTNTNGKNIGSRVYLMDTDTKYQMFNLLNQEFTFDVDMSKLPCGLNGAVYFVEMDSDGGMAKFPTNKAGAKYGTGYCDTQCPHDIKFINGEANVLDWTPSATDANAGNGRWGTCCNEMDIWEANSIASAYTPHVCKHSGLKRCDNPIDCGDGDNRYKGVCDKDGCDFNSFRMGDKTFLGPGKTVDTNKKITVVTQFLTSNNQTTGDLVEIRRLYVQDGKVIQNSKVNIPGMPAYDSISDQFCIDQKKAFNDNNAFIELGGHKAMGNSFKNGMVLALSIWGDHAAHMLWLDSDYPLDRPASQPGVSRGTCPQSSGDPKDLETSAANAVVTYSNIKWGPIGSTFSGTTNPPTTQPPTTQPPTTQPPTTQPPTTQPPTTQPPAAQQTRWGQCGGNGYTGPTQCVAGTTCTAIAAPWYYQCL